MHTGRLRWRLPDLAIKRSGLSPPCSPSFLIPISSWCGHWVIASGAAGAYTFIPFILLDTGLDAHLFWRLGTGAQIVWFTAIPLYRRRQTTQVGATYLGGVMPYSYPIFLALSVPTLGILVLNTAVLGAPWPYVLGIFLILITAFTTFVRLLLDSWRPQA